MCNLTGADDVTDKLNDGHGPASKKRSAGRPGWVARESFKRVLMYPLSLVPVRRILADVTPAVSAQNPDILLPEASYTIVADATAQNPDILLPEASFTIVADATAQNPDILLPEASSTVVADATLANAATLTAVTSNSISAPNPEDVTEKWLAELFEGYPVEARPNIFEVEGQKLWDEGEAQLDMIEDAVAKDPKLLPLLVNTLDNIYNKRVIRVLAATDIAKRLSAEPKKTRKMKATVSVGFLNKPSAIAALEKDAALKAADVAAKEKTKRDKAEAGAKKKAEEQRILQDAENKAEEERLKQENKAEEERLKQEENERQNEEKRQEEAKEQERLLEEHKIQVRYKVASRICIPIYHIMHVMLPIYHIISLEKT